ncbi:hypothetical protein PsorP6_011562 [Peronosclerospora sorghi]|uniref:Uncharacterized protein n=1 Tax=Peronosclerospora sorghi TaxID=230839 RepID=A0ACC0WM74_9STRA|nr:hypothetical protein PsorP6_011562 [Peronosclerospora sorghi]
MLEMVAELAVPYTIVGLFQGLGNKNVLIMDEILHGFDGSNHLCNEVVISMLRRSGINVCEAFDDLLVPNEWKTTAQEDYYRPTIPTASSRAIIVQLPCSKLCCVYQVFFADDTALVGEKSMLANQLAKILQRASSKYWLQKTTA